MTKKNIPVVLFIALLIISMLALSLTYLPVILVQFSEKQVAKDQDYTYAGIVDKYRATLAQIFAGLVVLGGLYYTARNVAATEQSNLTKAFSDATGQLGSVDKNNSPLIAIRLGAIYALERLARIAPKDSHIICNILAIYVQEESTRRKALHLTAADKSSISDLEAALIVMSLTFVLKPAKAKQRLQIYRAYLPYMTLAGRIFSNFEFHNCVISNWDLEFSVCKKSICYQCEADGCNFSNALLDDSTFNNIRGSVICNFLHARKMRILGSTLTDSDFSNAILDSAQFSNTDFSNSNFSRASMRHTLATDCIFDAASFDGADLEGADLSGSDLSNALGLTWEQLRLAKSLPVNLPPYLGDSDKL